jgi:hypothetical protein
MSQLFWLLINEPKLSSFNAQFSIIYILLQLTEKREATYRYTHKLFTQNNCEMPVLTCN